MIGPAQIVALPRGECTGTSLHECTANTSMTFIRDNPGRTGAFACLLCEFYNRSFVTIKVRVRRPLERPAVAGFLVRSSGLKNHPQCPKEKTLR
jgi:hypothetical protein